MLRLKAAKTSLYKLVHYYEPLPPMGRTQFTKASRDPDYWLEWTDACGISCKAFLSCCGGKALLAITKRDGGAEVSCVVHGLELSDLLERGMVEVFTPRGGVIRAALLVDSERSAAE